MVNEISFGVYMRGLCRAPGDYNICKECGGIGLKPIYCCDGRECGCYGLPIDFVDCECGTEKPTIEQIKKWEEG